MSGRTGPPFKFVFYGVVFIGFVYILYVYNATNGKLRDAEHLAERYRREEETKVTQLQDLLKSKEELQEKSDNDRQEFISRLNSINQQHKMLKSRNEEMEADYGRLQQELQKLKEDQEHLESQRNQEFQQLKQEKELEIASVKDQVANYQRQNEQLQNEISSLKAQIQNSQNQAAVQGQQQQAAAQQAQMAANAGGGAGVVDMAQQQAQNNQQQQQQQAGNPQQVQQLAVEQQGNVAVQGDHQIQPDPAHLEQDKNQNQQAAQQAAQQGHAAVVEQAVDQHQVQAPNGGKDSEGDAAKNEEFQGMNNKLPELNGQIFKPDFKGNEDILKQDLKLEQDGGLSKMNDIEIDRHDNRMEHDGPVNLQVQEPKFLANKDEKFDNNIPQQIEPAGGIAQMPLQPQVQMDIPKVGAQGNDLNNVVNGRGVRVEGEGRNVEEGKLQPPMPQM